MIETLVDCGDRSRVSGVGEITAEDGTTWTVPAATALQDGPIAADLFNQCGGIQLNGPEDIDLASVSIVDAGGNEVFTAYIFADNYFELYVNGTLIALDAVPLTPFNSNVLQFHAERPVTLAIMVVDWEENRGLGSEDNRGSAFHPGDGGFVAVFEDANGETAAITNDAWRAQTFYNAPLNDRACLLIASTSRDSST